LRLRNPRHGRERCRQLRPVAVLAALDLGELADQLPVASCHAPLTGARAAGASILTLLVPKPGAPFPGAPFSHARLPSPRLISMLSKSGAYPRLANATPVLTAPQRSSPSLAWPIRAKSRRALPERYLH